MDISTERSGFKNVKKKIQYFTNKCEKLCKNNDKNRPKNKWNTQIDQLNREKIEMVQGPNSKSTRPRWYLRSSTKPSNY